MKLNDYSAFEKAQILYNHIYSRGLNSEAILAITQDKFYTKIIAHINYTPRIIESITKPQTVNAFNLEEYREFILNNLKNPEKIWSSSFHNQVHYFDQRLLLTLFTCPYGMEETNLQAAFESRMAYEKAENNQVIKSNQYRDSINTLLNGFITSSLVTEPEFSEADKIKREFKLINPSLSDYIAAYVKESHLEKKGILSSAVYIEQLVHFNPQDGLIPIEKDLQIIIRDRISSGELDSLDQFKAYRFDGLVLETLCRYCVEISIDHLLLEYLQKIDFSASLWWIKGNLMYLLLNLGDAPITKAYIVKNFQKMMESLIKVIESEQAAKKIPDIFKRYDVDYQVYISSPASEGNVINMLAKTSKYREKITKMIWQDKVTDLNEVENLYSALKKEDDQLANLLIESNTTAFSSLRVDREFWNNKIEANIVKENELDDQITVSLFKEPQIKPHKEKEAIDLLFSTSGWEQLTSSTEVLTDGTVN